MTPPAASLPDSTPYSGNDSRGPTASPAKPAPVPRLALSPAEAAAAIGVSRDFLDEHVLPELRIVRRGRRRLIPVRELERWLAAEAAFTLERPW